MYYPVLEVSLDKMIHNTRSVIEQCGEFGVNVVGVDKVACGSVELAEAMVEGGIEIIGDSRIRNLKKLQDVKAKKMLIRLPMISQVEEVIRYSDISLNSEVKTIKKLSEEALKQGKIHQVILMVDVGDLREGIFNEYEVMDTVEEILNLKGVELLGIGTNLSCYGAILPTKENLGGLLNIKEKIENRFDIKLEVVSGGNSSSYHLIQSGDIPNGINQLRIGTSLILGIVESNETDIKDTYQDAFKLTAEIIEIKEKPSKPIGVTSIDAFGNKPTFEDIGIRKRAICAIGKQDIDPDWMIPEDSSIKVLGGSSDHTILDITDCEKGYDIGDKVTFTLTYVAILKGMTSEYVTKKYV